MREALSLASLEWVSRRVLFWVNIEEGRVGQRREEEGRKGGEETGEGMYVGEVCAEEKEREEKKKLLSRGRFERFD